MSLGLSASVLVVPLLLTQSSSSNTVLNGLINSNHNDSLTAYDIGATTAKVVIQAANVHSATQTASMTTVVNNYPYQWSPDANTLAYQSFSAIVPADQIVLNETAEPNTLVAPAHAVLPPPPVKQVVVATKVQTAPVVHYVTPAVTPTVVYSNTRVGAASWYGAPFGTCANTSLPFGTVVHVTNLGTGASTTCRVEDRGPYVGGRILDLSEGTFSQIASTSQGVINIKMEW